MISRQAISKIIKLYTTQRYSAQLIANELRLSLKQVYYYLNCNGIQRRSISESNKIGFQKKDGSFTFKKNLSSIDREIYSFCLAMYWCEGYQASSARGVDFANSNPKMICLFIYFLKSICGVDISRIRCYLYCYSNQNSKNLLEYWSHLTSINISQFTKPYVRNDFRLDKINKMPYGVLHVRYYDKKLLIEIKERISEIAAKLIMGGYRSSQTGQTVQ